METKLISMIPDRDAQIFHFSQNDKGRDIRCGLYDGVLTKVLNGAENLTLRYKKPDGTVGFLPVSNTSTSYVDISIPNTMTDKAGKVYCKLHVDGVGTKAFYLDVEGRP